MRRRKNLTMSFASANNKNMYSYQTLLVQKNMTQNKQHKHRATQYRSRFSTSLHSAGKSPLKTAWTAYLE